MPTFDRMLEAMERREDNERFINAVLPYVRSVALDRQFFTVDDVSREWFAGGCPGDVASDARAWGLVMRRARKLGMIEPTGHFSPSENESCHATPRRVWRSLMR